MTGSILSPPQSFQLTSPEYLLILWQNTPTSVVLPQKGLKDSENYIRMKRSQWKNCWKRVLSPKLRHTGSKDIANKHPKYPALPLQEIRSLFLSLQDELVGNFRDNCRTYLPLARISRQHLALGSKSGNACNLYFCIL